MMKKFFNFLLLFFALYTSAIAAEIEYKQILSGTRPEAPLKEKSIIDFRDPEPGIFTTERYYSKVSLVYNRDRITDQSSSADWSAKVQYTISFLDAAGEVRSSFVDTLNLSFTKTGIPVYASTDLFDSPGANYSRVRVVLDKVSPGIPQDVSFEVSLIKTVGENTATAITPKLAYDATNKRAYWTYGGSESYELEWVYIDKYDPVISFSTDDGPFLAKQPVKITTWQQYFDFINTYPNGKIYFRVRGVGNYGGGISHVIKYGNWSYGNGAIKAICTNAFNFDSTKTWISVTNFNEEGKYKKVTTFYDETLRERQSKVNLSSDNTVLISEKKYDYEGRPAIQFLPAPKAGNSMDYEKDFNVFSIGRKAFDKIDNAGTDPVLSSSGAGKYYSTNNDFTSSVNRDFVPATSYPFMQTIYTRDNENRIAASSQPGDQFKIHKTGVGSDFHYTSNYYLTPTEVELKRLFGANVGDESHYEKQIAIDANGQVSITYYDQQGRIVATSLAGTSPGNMEQLASNTSVINSDQSLSTNNSGKTNYLSSSTNKIFNMLPNQTYDFKYDLEGVMSKVEICDQAASSTVLGTTGSYNNEGNTREKAFDGNTSTFFDSPTRDGAWVGLELSSIAGQSTPPKLCTIKYFPREGLAQRMVGGKFQACDKADFSSGVVDLYTITVEPSLRWNEAALTLDKAYKYVRYISPSGGWGNVAEIKFYGKQFTGPCQECVYLLKVKIVNPNGTVIKDITEILKPGTVSCTGTGSYTVSAVNAELKGVTFADIGEYIITKELIVDPASVNAFMTDITNPVLNKDAGLPNYDFIETDYTEDIDPSLCDFSCEEHCFSKIKKENPTWTDAQIQAQVPSCVTTNCGAIINKTINDIVSDECESVKRQIFMQLRPEGYYNALSGWLTNNVIGKVSFTDGNGNAMTVTEAMLQDASQFKENWLDEMWTKHPEYCHYNICILNKSTTVYEKQMAMIKDWGAAKTAGYLNPLGMTIAEGLPSSLSSSPQNLDSFFVLPVKGSVEITKGMGFNELQNLKNKLKNYRSESADGIDYNGGGINGYVSLWDYVGYRGLYGDLNSSTNPPPNPIPDDKKWQMFQGLYLAEKIKIKNTLTGQGGNIAATASTAAVKWDACSFQSPDAEQTIVIKPELPDYTKWANKGNQLLKEDCYHLSDINSQLWVRMLEDKCGIVWKTAQDKIDVTQYFKNYISFSCGYTNPQGLLLTSQLNNANLVNAQSILTTYNCQLTNISVEDPCIKTMSVPHISYTVSDAVFTYYLLMQDIIKYSESLCNVKGSNCISNLYNKDLSIELFPTYRNNRKFFNDAFGGALLKLMVVPTYNNGVFAGLDVWFNRASQGSTSYTGASYWTTLAINGITDPNKICRIGNFRPDPLNPSYYMYDITLYDNSIVPYPTNRTLPANPGFTWTHIFSKSGVDYNSGNVTFCTEYKNDVFPPLPPLTGIKAKCLALQTEEAKDKATKTYNEALDNYKSEYLSKHYQKCFASPFKENFYFKGPDPGKYHFTLYYYDQAGNLVQTVPPAGVDALAVDDVNFPKGAYGGGTPQHRMKTKYKYNSANQLIWQETPDGGATWFYYNNKGQLVLSQNAKQKAASVSATNKYVYSYTKYDGLGRVVEVGEMKDLEWSIDYLNDETNRTTILDKFNNPSFPSSSYDLRHMTITVYDNAYAGSPFTQNNLRNRIAATISKPDNLNTGTVTYYSYDPHGNIEKLAQDLPDIAAKVVAYDYDLISNNVRKVKYQEGQSDQFFHQYRYDADNRLVSVKTSRSGILWEEDAKYSYYKHGLLARTELGNDKIQGLDYYYTAQGWLKGINIPQKTTDKSGFEFVSSDLGKDGMGQSRNHYMAQDEFSMGLTYFQGDYSPLGTTVSSMGILEPGTAWEGILGPLNKKGLYNGNIVYWANTQRSYGLLKNPQNPVNVNGTFAFAYRYDQLNRLTHAYNHMGSQLGVSRTYGVLSSDTHKAFDAHYKYDPNGNIEKLFQAGSSGTLIDNLQYKYPLYTVGGVATTNYLNNKLQYVADDAGTTSITSDIEPGQGTTNYGYDPIGNLERDDQSKIKSIIWSPYGKILEIQKTDNSPGLIFEYDAAGQRVVKRKKYNDGSGKIYKTYYIRDALGNVLSTYSSEENGLTLVEQPIYGSDRVGMVTPNISMSGTSGSTRIMTTQPSAVQGKDTYILVGNATNNGTNAVLQARVAGTSQYRSYLTFDLSSVPSDATIENAVLYLSAAPDYTHAGASNGALIKRVTGTWTETALTGTNEPATTATNQVITANLSGTAGMTATVTNLIKDMISNGNNGMQLSISSGADGNALYFASSDDKNPALWPKLVITYKQQATGEAERKVSLKLFELKDHLGNVRTTVEDRKLASTINIPVTDKYYYNFEGSANFPNDSRWPGGTLSGAQARSWYTSVLQSYPATEMGANVIIPVTGGDKISAEVFAKFLAGTKGGILVMHLRDINQNGPHYVTDPAAVLNTWNQLSIPTVTVPSGQGIVEAVVYLRVMSDQSQTWFDDMKVTVDRNSNEKVYAAMTNSFNDYSPFGMILDGRTGTKTYRYGFNGKEMDNDVKDGITGAQYDYGFRIYDPRLARFLSIDPLTKEYPWYTPYQFAGNTPIAYIDRDGLEPEETVELIGKDASEVLKTSKAGDIINYNGYKYKVTNVIPTKRNTIQANDGNVYEIDYEVGRHSVPSERTLQVYDSKGNRVAMRASAFGSGDRPVGGPSTETTITVNSPGIYPRLELVVETGNIGFGLGRHVKNDFFAKDDENCIIFEDGVRFYLPGYIQEKVEVCIEELNKYGSDIKGNVELYFSEPYYQKQFLAEMKKQGFDMSRVTAIDNSRDERSKDKEIVVIGKFYKRSKSVPMKSEGEK